MKKKKKQERKSFLNKFLYHVSFVHELTIMHHQKKTLLCNVHIMYNPFSMKHFHKMCKSGITHGVRYAHSELCLKPAFKTRQKTNPILKAGIGRESDNARLFKQTKNKLVIV